MASKLTNSKSKHQCWSIELYDEHKDLIDKIMDYVISKDGIYAGIKHDKDIYKEMTFTDTGKLLGVPGQVKQLHYHIFIKLPYGVYDTDIKSKTDVPLRFLLPVAPKNFESKILYLTHKNAPDKYPYETIDIFTNRQDYINYIYDNYNDIPPLDIFAELFKFINESKQLNYGKFLIHCINCGFDYTTIKRYWGICKDILYENHFNKNEIRIKNMKDYEKKLVEMFDNLNIDENGQKEIFKYIQLKLNGEESI